MKPLLRPIAIYLTLALVIAGGPVGAAELPAVSQDAAPEKSDSMEATPEADGPNAGSALPDSRLPDSRLPSPSPRDEAAPPEDVELQARIDALRAEHDQINPNEGRGGIIAGGVLLGVGVLMGAVTGLGCASANSGDDTTCRNDVATGLGIGAGVLALGGITSLIVNTSKRRRARNERAGLQSEMDALRREKATRKSGRLDMGVLVGEQYGLVIGWRY